MLKIANTSATARALFNSLMVSGVYPCFDLDGVLLDASARQMTFTLECVEAGKCTKAQIGHLNLDEYRKNSTPSKIMKDKSLPLLECIKLLNKANKPYHVLTARVICSGTKRLLNMRDIKPVSLMARSGEHDHRPDPDLKCCHLVSRFSLRERENMVLIDDNLANLKAVQHVGLKAIHVPFEGH